MNENVRKDELGLERGIVLKVGHARLYKGGDIIEGG